jgi:hypothetical protein
VAGVLVVIPMVNHRVPSHLMSRHRVPRVQPLDVMSLLVQIGVARLRAALVASSAVALIAHPADRRVQLRLIRRLPVKGEMCDTPCAVDMHFPYSKQAAQVVLESCQFRGIVAGSKAYLCN